MRQCIISQSLAAKTQASLADPTYREGYNNALFAILAIKLLPPLEEGGKPSES